MEGKQKAKPDRERKRQAVRNDFPVERMALKRQGLRVRRPRKFVATTDSRPHTSPVYSYGQKEQ